MCFVAPREQRGDVFHDEWRVPWCVCASLPGPAAWYPGHLYWGDRGLAKNGPWSFPEWQMSEVPGMDAAWQGKCTLSLVMSFSHFTTGCRGELDVSRSTASAATCRPYLELAVAKAAWEKWTDRHKLFIMYCLFFSLQAFPHQPKLQNICTHLHKKKCPLQTDSGISPRGYCWSCVTALCSLLQQSPVRLQCVRALQGLYRETEFIGRLELFTGRFKVRSPSGRCSYLI